MEVSGTRERAGNRCLGINAQKELKQRGGQDHSVKGQSHPGPEPWPLTAEGHSGKDCREDLGRMKVGVELLTRSQVKPVPQGREDDEGAQGCPWPWLICLIDL